MRSEIDPSDAGVGGFRDGGVGAGSSDELERSLLLAAELGHLLEHRSIHREGQLRLGFENSLRFHLAEWF